ncbi:type VI secretion system baseplate subunit TssK [Alcaligenes sp. SDU_A2]|uniref:type VI secretion system baseplate subunit TssK n=1 Tax=Alcaligenes sp. SDU_A2 TaxID=3136634 RepID=UPI00311E1AA3
MDKVIWTEGLFLRPQHFQQLERYLEQYAQAGRRATQPFFWGFETLVLDEQALGMGSVALREARGLFPDGTPFDCGPGTAQALGWTAPQVVRPERIMLVLPRCLPGRVDIQFGESGARRARYAVIEQELHDSCGLVPEPCQSQLGRLQPCLLPESEVYEDSVAIAVARVLERRQDRSLVLDPDFIAPVLSVQAHARLHALSADVQALLQARGQALAERLGPGGRGQGDVADMLMLELVNRFRSALWALEQRVHVHPCELYQQWMQLHGALATYTQPSRQPQVWPPYRHDDLAESFLPLVVELRRALSVVLEQQAVSIALEDKGQGVRLAQIADRALLRQAGFVLAVQADLPAQTVRQHFAAQAKLGPVERIRDLVHLQLPGIGLQPLSVAPRALPYHAGFTYFELEKGGELWRQMEQNGALALHLAGDFPGLQLEFWAIRH